MTIISVINESTVVPDADLKVMVEAVQLQVAQDFAPHWHTPATLIFVPKGVAPQPGTQQVAVLDTTDQNGVLGYHDLTQDGLPLAKIFAKTDLDAGLMVSVTLSHEVLEMLADPWLNHGVYRQPTNTLFQFWPLEVCDAVEDDQFSYQLGGINVSDFVLPNYFRDILGPNAKADFTGVLPVGSVIPALSAGGYTAEFDTKTGQWSQVFAQHQGGRAHPDRVRGRFEKRAKPLHEWKRSTRVWA